MQPAAVALDIQALQPAPGTGLGRAGLAAPARRAPAASTPAAPAPGPSAPAAPSPIGEVATLAGRLAATGRLAAALLAPEWPPPPVSALPAELTGAGADLLRWDCRAEARRLLSRHPELVHVVAAPLLHAAAGEPAGLVVNRHWADSGAPRVVHLDRAAVAALAGAAPESRLAVRLEWIRASALVVTDHPDAAGILGLEPSRVAGPDEWLDRLDGVAAISAPQSVLPPRLALVGPFPPAGGGLGAYNARFAAAAARTGATVDAVTATGDAVGATGDAVGATGDAVGATGDAVGATGRAGPDRPRVGLVRPAAFGTDERPASYDGPLYILGNSDGHLATVEAALRHPGWLWLHEARLPAVATTALDGLDDEAFAAHMEHLLEAAYPGRSPWPAARRAGRSHLALARAGVGLTSLLVSRAAGVFVNSQAARAALLLDQPPLAAMPPVVVLPPACPPVRPRPMAAPVPPAAAPAPPAAAPAPGPSPVAVAFGVVSMGKRPDLLIDAAARVGCRLAFVGPCPEILAKVIGDRAQTRGISDAVEVVGAVDDRTWWDWMARATVALQLRDTAGGEMSAAVLDALAAGVPVITNLASAADYPPGTVDLLADSEPTVEALAGRLAALLADGDLRARLAEGAQAFAAAHQMDALVAAVVTALTETPR